MACEASQLSSYTFHSFSRVMYLHDTAQTRPGVIEWMSYSCCVNVLYRLLL